MKTALTMMFMLLTIFSSQTVYACDTPEWKVHPLLLPKSYSAPRTNPITHIVIHSISNVERKPQSPYDVYDIYMLLQEYGVSAHFLINREGEVFQLVPENRVAFHAGKSSLPNAPFFQQDMNAFSIGIEVMGIGKKEEMVPYFITEEAYDTLEDTHIGYTDEQYHALNYLLKTLTETYPTIPKNRYHIIGHDDYAPFRKQDPGKLFNWCEIGYKP